MTQLSTPITGRLLATPTLGDTRIPISKTAPIQPGVYPRGNPLKFPPAHDPTIQTDHRPTAGDPNSGGNPLIPHTHIHIPPVQKGARLTTSAHLAC